MGKYIFILIFLVLIKYSSAQTVDTVWRGLKVVSDSFCIMYVNDGNYMSTAVAHVRFDSAGNMIEDTAFEREDRHYFSHVSVYIVRNGIRSIVGKGMDGFYVPHGCYEDVPENWIIRAKRDEKLK